MSARAFTVATASAILRRSAASRAPVSPASVSSAAAAVAAAAAATTAVSASSAAAASAAASARAATSTTTRSAAAAAAATVISRRCASSCASPSVAAATAAGEAEAPLVRVERDTALGGGAVVVTMDRARLHNAFGEALIEELTAAFRAISEEAAAAGSSSSSSGGAAPRVVVLTGAGKSFSAGADLSWMRRMAQYSEEENRRDSLALYDMFQAIRACPLPVIARVNGRALGGGVGLVAACDIAVASDVGGAADVFGLTEVRLGLIPAVISPFVLGKIGRAAAARYFLTGDRFSAEEARRIGLVDSVHATPEDLDAAVASLCKSIAASGPDAVARCKRLVHHVSENNDTAHPALREHLAGEIAAARVGQEGQAGLGAFLNKEKAPWTQ